MRTWYKPVPTHEAGDQEQRLTLEEFVLGEDDDIDNFVEDAPILNDEGISIDFHYVCV